MIARPAGFSDDESDDEGFHYNMARHRSYYNHNAENLKNKQREIERNIEDAILNSDIEALDDIVKKDLNDDVNEQLSSGWTSLMHAASQAQDIIVESLLDKGADPNKPCDSVTPLMAVCSNESSVAENVINVINSLLDHDAVLNIGDKYGQTPLMRAIKIGRIVIVQTLLKHHVNIELRDSQGWTAVFWAVHHNQPEILELLIGHGARLSELDKMGRHLIDIALANDHKVVYEILNNHLNPVEEEQNGTQCIDGDDMPTWENYFAGISVNNRPTYSHEVQNLLYGMHCERLLPLFRETKISLKDFLLLTEEQMLEYGVEFPFERKRLDMGLRRFHKKGWKLDSVAGLYAQKMKFYGVLEYLNVSGSHLQQLYIIDATIKYTARSFKVLETINDKKSSSEIQSLASGIAVNVTAIKKELLQIENILKKVNKENPPPPDFIYAEEKKTSSFSQFILRSFLLGVLSSFSFFTLKNACKYLKSVENT